MIRGEKYQYSSSVPASSKARLESHSQVGWKEIGICNKSENMWCLIPFLPLLFFLFILSSEFFIYDFRMMDPIILYYGKGQLTGFLADPKGVIDVVGSIYFLHLILFEYVAGNVACGCGVLL